jgi:GPH family glycoside/pentoside/hexuronide:cation symporter
MDHEAAQARAGDTRKPLSFWTMLTFAVANMPNVAQGIALLIFLPRYFASHLHVSLVDIGLASAVVRAIDIGVDPALGVLMDRTRTSLGRYRVWLLAGVPILILSVWRLYFAPDGIGLVYLVGWLLMLYLATSILTLAYTAWGANLATAYHDRAKLGAVAQPLSMLVGMIILFLPAVSKFLGGTDAQGVQAMGVFIIAIAPIAIGFAAWRTPEKIAPHVAGPAFTLKDYWALITRPAVLRLSFAAMSLSLGPGWQGALYLFFANEILGFSIPAAAGLVVASLIGGAIGAAVFAQLSRRIGKHRTLMVATTTFSLGMFSFLLVHHGNVLMGSLTLGLLGFAQAGYLIMMTAMMADVGDEVRLEQGKERMGLLYSLVTGATKIAGALALGLSYPLLAILGFRPGEGAANSHQALLGLELAYYIAPVFFVMLGGLCFIGWRLTAERHGDIRRQLDERDAALIEAARGEPSN